eukprot:756023-Hanusia_phi.AAC.11
MYPTKLAHIYPRKKQGEIQRKNHHVAFTLEEISALFHLKQSVAAQRMGISLTAFKSACRRVGLSRWPYLRKHSSSEQTCVSPASPVESSDDLGQRTHVEESRYHVANPSLFNDAFLHVAGEWF